jgi:hypothetical protein
MMEKNKFLMLIVMVLASILVIGNVNAEESTCSPTDLNKLRQEAANVKATYVPTTMEIDGTVEDIGDNEKIVESVLDMKVYNVTEKMALRYEYSGNGVKSGSFMKSYANVGSDGAITVRQKSYGKIITYTITVLSSYGSCSGQSLKTIRITLPMFNYYSLLDACEGIQDYYLCQPYVTSEVGGADFFDKVEAYRAKMLSNEAIEVEDDNNSVVTSAFVGIKKHKYLIVGLVVAAGVVATVLILRRKKSEV